MSKENEVMFYLDEVISEINSFKAVYERRVHNDIYINRNFLTKWLQDNKSRYFDTDEDKNFIIELINLTSAYINAKESKQIHEAMYKNNPQKPDRHLSEIRKRIEKHLLSVQKDLEALSIKGTKTDEMLNLISDYCNHQDCLVPLQKKPNANVEAIRTHLNSIKLPKYAIDEYLEHFQDYSPIDDVFSNLTFQVQQ